MRDLNLRIAAGYFVKESSLPKPAKLQLLNFIQQEASDAQVKALLLDGQVVFLDEYAEQIVEDRWNASMLEGVASKAALYAKHMAKSKAHMAKGMKRDILGWRKYGAARQYRKAMEVGGVKKQVLPTGQIITPKTMKGAEKQALKRAAKRTAVAAAGVGALGGAGYGVTKATKKK